VLAGVLLLFCMGVKISIPTQRKITDCNGVLRIFATKWEEETGPQSRLHNVECHSLCSSPNIFTLIKSTTVLMNPAARMGQIDIYKV
jgi:hypothetical protein